MLFQKIIKNKWHKSESKRENHDRSVENNWKLLKEGKVELPENLVKHLLKFTSRKPNTQNFQQERKIITPPMKKGEFSAIIDSYQQLKNKSTEIEKPEQPTTSCNDKLLGETVTPYANKMVPLRYLKEPEIKTDVPETQVNVDLEKIFHGKESKYLTKTSNAITTQTAKEKSLVVKYPEKIKIPKDKYKKGFTYKVNDCYYDDDGEFLYRVPGMY